MNNDEVNQLGISAIQNLCDNLMPPSEIDGDPLGSDTEDSVDLMPAADYIPSHPIDVGTLNIEGKPKRSWRRKIYPTSAVRRSTRIKLKKKFHDDL